MQTHIPLQFTKGVDTVAPSESAHSTYKKILKLE